MVVFISFHTLCTLIALGHCTALCYPHLDVFRLDKVWNEMLAVNRNVTFDQSKPSDVK